MQSNQPVIETWRDLKIGDVVKCVLVCDGGDGSEMFGSDAAYHGVECNVIGFTETGLNHIRTDLRQGGYYIEKFEFIRRPE